MVALLPFHSRTRTCLFTQVFHYHVTASRTPSHRRVKLFVDALIPVPAPFIPSASATEEDNGCMRVRPLRRPSRFELDSASDVVEPVVVVVVRRTLFIPSVYGGSREPCQAPCDARNRHRPAKALSETTSPRAGSACQGPLKLWQKPCEGRR